METKEVDDDDLADDVLKNEEAFDDAKI